MPVSVSRPESLLVDVREQRDCFASVRALLWSLTSANEIPVVRIGRSVRYWCATLSNGSSSASREAANELRKCQSPRTSIVLRGLYLRTGRCSGSADIGAPGEKAKSVWYLASELAKHASRFEALNREGRNIYVGACREDVKGEAPRPTWQTPVCYLPTSTIAC